MLSYFDCRQFRILPDRLRRALKLVGASRRPAALGCELLEQRQLMAVMLTASPVAFSDPVIEGAYQGAVDAFTDDRANANPADFTANISWGDGTPDTAGIVVALGSGKFEVQGSHVYQVGLYGPAVTTSDTVAGLSETAVLPPSPGVLHVLDGSLAAGPVTMAPVDGVPFNGSLATFRDSSSLSQTADFTALIQWGDGTPDSAGTVSGGAGQFTVSGSHTYADSGNSVLKIHISSSEGESLLIASTPGWQTAAPLPTSRAAMAVTTGADGRIYAIGGGVGHPMGAVQAYDPVTDSWSNVADLPIPRFRLAAATGLDGRIYALGGVDSNLARVSQVDAYDPATNSWSSLAALPEARCGLAAATGADGRIYAFGGSNAAGIAVNDAEAYDPAANAWTAIAPMPVGRANFVAVRGADGRIYVLGGDDANGNFLATVDVYDPVTNAWTSAAPMPLPRDYFAGAAGPDGRIYAIGGHLGALLNSVDFYDPTTNTWSVAAPLPQASWDLGAALGSDGAIHVLGGDPDESLNLALAPYTPASLPAIQAVANDISGQTGVTLSGAIATFSDADPSLTSDDFAATIDWGDGSTSVGRVFGLPGDFRVESEHLWTKEGISTISVTILDTHGAIATAHSTVQLAEQIPVAASKITLGDDRVFSGTVATFSDYDAQSDPGQFTATIDWGDQSPPSTGTISAAPDGTFVVGSSHSWPFGFTHPLITITVQDADGASGAATTTVLLVGPNEVYANQVAVQLLGIPIDVTGAVYWTEQFLQGAPRTELTEKLVHDFHYLDRLLRIVYQQFLGRPIDDPGERYWVNRMLNGLTDEQLEASFVSSAEFYQHAGGSNAGWIEAMYESLLGRQADATGMNYWLSALNLGTSRTSAAIGFATSAEHEAYVLREDYITYLGRQASADEVFYWTSQFKRGLSNEDIVAQFTASDEYFKSHS